MANLIQSAKERVNEILAAACEKAAEKGQLPAGAVLSGSVEIPKDNLNGDFAANHALRTRGLQRMFLHAWQLDVPHPATGETLRLHAPLPAELDAFLRTLQDA